MWHIAVSIVMLCVPHPSELQSWLRVQGPTSKCARGFWMPSPSDVPCDRLTISMPWGLKNTIGRLLEYHALSHCDIHMRAYAQSYALSRTFAHDSACGRPRQRNWSLVGTTLRTVIYERRAGISRCPRLPGQYSHRALYDMPSQTHSSGQRRSNGLAHWRWSRSE
jgi:hypothetical protein